MNGEIMSHYVPTINTPPREGKKQLRKLKQNKHNEKEGGTDTQSEVIPSAGARKNSASRRAHLSKAERVSRKKESSR